MYFLERLVLLGGRVGRCVPSDRVDPRPLPIVGYRQDRIQVFQFLSVGVVHGADGVGQMGEDAHHAEIVL